MDELLKEIEAKFGPKFTELTEKAQELGEQLEASESRETTNELTEQLNRIDESVKELTSAREEELRVVEQKAVANRIETLEQAISAAKDDRPAFVLGGPVTGEQQKAIYSDHSFYRDASNLSKDPAATERWEEALGEKAMTSAQGSTGGYLVPPEISSELLQIREQSNVLRPLFSNLSVNSEVLRIAAITKGLTAAWVAELAEKPESELAFGEISVNTFTKAGLSVVSNQLLRDSNPSVDTLINRDLAKRLAALEEIAFIDGTGTGQPLGILRTPGVDTTPLTSTDVDDLLDAIVDSITEIYTNYFGAPNGILMHPRTWARIVKARKSDATTEYQVGPPSSGSGGGRDATNPLPGYGAGPNPTGALFGLPVYTSRNVPVNKGASDNESRIIVGNWSEGLILDHAGITLDSSPHVYFTSNQTIFRAEDQVGFTAARYPNAFNVIGGVGLANG